MFGKASGFEAHLDLSKLKSSDGFRLDGAHGYDNSGRSVSGAGDVNGDGFDDVIVDTLGADPNGPASGSSYVIFGSRDFGNGGSQLPEIKVLTVTTASRVALRQNISSPVMATTTCLVAAERMFSMPEPVTTPSASAIRRLLGSMAAMATTRCIWQAPI